MPKRITRPFTEAEDRRITALSKSGLTTRQIAAQVQRAESSVRKRLERLALPDFDDDGRRIARADQAHAGPAPKFPRLAD